MEAARCVTSPFRFVGWLQDGEDVAAAAVAVEAAKDAARRMLPTVVRELHRNGLRWGLGESDEQILEEKAEACCSRWGIDVVTLLPALLDSEEDALLESYRCKNQACDGFLLPESGEKGYTCHKCSNSRDEDEVEKMTREILLLSDKASSFVSSGSILYPAVHD